LALDLGNPEIAIHAIEGALISNPSLAGDPWWHEEPSRDTAFEEAYGRVIADAGPRTWQVAMYAGDLGEAARIVDLLPSDQRGTASQVLAARGGSAVAYETLVENCIARPLDPSLGWCRLTSAHVGDPVALQRFDGISRLATVSGGPTDELLIADDGGADSVAGNNAVLWGVQTYRRFTPWDMLSPSLLHLAAR
jgi:hypothetical protein